MSEPIRPAKIRVLAICVFHRDDRILVFEGFDRIKGTYYARPLGGAVEPGETSRNALVREIREELGEEIEGLQRLGVLENLFTLDGQLSHEVVFVYEGRFADPTVYDREGLAAVGDNGEPLALAWRPLDFFNERHHLVPEGLRELLEQTSRPPGTT